MSGDAHSLLAFLLFFIGDVYEVQHRINIGFVRRELKLTR